MARFVPRPDSALAVRSGNLQHPGATICTKMYSGSCVLRPASCLQRGVLGKALPPESVDPMLNSVLRWFGLRHCGVTLGAASSAGAKATTPRDLHELDVDLLHDDLEALLDEQWQRASADFGMDPAPDTGANGTVSKVKHVVGGFSVVVRLPEKGLAYRLQPMRSPKAGLTWVAFYQMLQEAALDRQAGAQAAAADVLYRPDRSVVLGKEKFRTSSPRKMAWEHLDIAREFQGARLRHATKRLVHFRHQLLKTSSAAYKDGTLCCMRHRGLGWKLRACLRGHAFIQRTAPLQT